LPPVSSFSRTVNRPKVLPVRSLVRASESNLRVSHPQLGYFPLISFLELAVNSVPAGQVHFTFHIVYLPLFDARLRTISFPKVFPVKSIKSGIISFCRFY